KGGMTLRMLQHVIGEGAFRDGLREYMRTHQRKNVDGNDLWGAFSVASGRDVPGLMRSWLYQTGHPIIDVEVRKGTEGYSLHLTQSRFMYNGKGDDKTIWAIPLWIEVDGKQLDMRMMSGKEMDVALARKPGVVKVNSGERGFYRARYSGDLLEKLVTPISKKTLSREDRWGVHRDLSSRVIAGEVSLDDYLGFVRDAYRNEDDLLVTRSLYGSLDMLRTIAKEDEARQSIDAVVGSLSRSIVDKLGLEHEKGESKVRTAIRSSALLHLGRLGDKRVLDKVNDWYGHVETLPGDLRTVVYSLVAAHGNARTFQELTDRYRAETDVQEKSRILTYGLAGFQDSKLVRRALEFGRSDEVRQQDFLLIARGLMANPVGVHEFWPWMRSNWDVLRKDYKDMINHVQHMVEIPSITADRKVGEQMKRVLLGRKLHGTENAVKQALEKLDVYATAAEHISKSRKTAGLKKH
ncbi:MAG: M1 family metallopeptidase, partial [Nanoarchaeota archaeon]|nr:M1 family metallopeptidase [Nanoarchaeota archaeon]